MLPPEALDVNNSLEELKLEDIIKSIIKEGCIGETLAAIEAHYRQHLAQDHDVKGALKVIAEDETKHAKLAWDTVAWIAMKYPNYRNLIKSIFDQQLDKQQHIQSKMASSPATICPDNKKDEYFKRFGILAPSDQEKIGRFGMEKIIKPTYDAGIDQFSSIFDKIMSMNVNFI